MTIDATLDVTSQEGQYIAVVPTGAGRTACRSSEVRPQRMRGRRRQPTRENDDKESLIMSRKPRKDSQIVLHYLEDATVVGGLVRLPLRAFQGGN